MDKTACTHCDLLVNITTIEQGEKAICPRCHQLLYLDDKSFSSSLALLFTALLVYFPAVLLPFLNMKTSGKEQQISLLTSVTEIATGNTAFLALAIFLLVLTFPLINILGLLSIMVPLSKGKTPFFGIGMTRFIMKVAPWNMIEVYLVGVLVTLVKLSSLADIAFLQGFYAFVILIIINTLIALFLPRKRIWQRIMRLNDA